MNKRIIKIMIAVCVMLFAGISAKAYDNVPVENSTLVLGESKKISYIQPTNLNSCTFNMWRDDPSNIVEFSSRTSPSTTIQAKSLGTVCIKQECQYIISDSSSFTQFDIIYIERYNITVKPKLSQKSLTMQSNTSTQLAIDYNKSAAYNKLVLWESTDPSVAAVSSDGTVVALSPGTTNINIQTVDGTYTDTCKVTVNAVDIDDDTPQICIGSAKAKPGGTVDVPILLKNNPGFANLSIEVGYDQDAMELVNVANAEVGGTYTAAQDLTAYPYNMQWDSTNNISYNGELATLTFKLKEELTDAIYPITVDYYKGINKDYKDGDDINYNEDYEAVGFEYFSNAITVYTFIPGDLNSDFKVTNKDATYMLKHLAGWEQPDLNTDRLDIDGSGKINNKDATSLLRYLAGWDIELH